MKEIDKRKLLYCYFVILFCGVMFYLYRIRWGMADVDEGFYLTIPLRMFQGDALLFEEWHVSQLSALLEYPILKIYMLFAKDTEGIILAFRYIYSNSSDCQFTCILYNC